MHLLLRRIAGACLPLCLAVPAARADLPDLSLEELLKTEVTTASRKSQALFDVAAAAFVLNADDIRRSGATTLPDVLRLVPGVEVAQLGAGQWAVTVRGGNGRFANKLLVLVDGRSIYSPVFSGVFWEGEAPLPEDIERIEVIRGPGAAMWGANAVNGVINVITRRALQTQGAAAAARGGTPGIAGASARYGFQPSERWYARISADTSRDELTRTPEGADAGRRRTDRVGIRADSQGDSVRHVFIVDANDYHVDNLWRVPQPLPPYAAASLEPQTGGSASMLWRSEIALDAASALTLQASASESSLKLLALDYRARQLDFDAQHHYSFSGRHELLWGGALRSYRDRVDSGYPIDFSKSEADIVRASAFFQYDWAVLPDSVRLSLGTRVEKETGSLVQWQPNVRLLWLPAPGHTLWASAGRASRLMARGERDADVTIGVFAPGTLLPGPLPVEVRAVGAAAGSEEAEHNTAFELGYRGELAANVFLDVALFQHRLTKLRSGRPRPIVVLPVPSPRLALELETVNTETADVSGAEIFVEMRPRRGLRLQTGLSLQHVSEDQTLGALPVGVGGNSPGWQVFVRAGLDPRAGHAIDLIGKRVGSLRAGAVPAYTRLDLRYAVALGHDVEFALVGQNLLDQTHPEIVPDFLTTNPVVVRRSVFARVAYRF